MSSGVTKRAAVLIALLSAVSWAQAAPADLGPSGDEWVAHLKNDLLPFYSVPAALGNPVGEFPSVRCDDGSLVNYSNPCAPIADNGYLAAPNRYLVAMSRQVYGYGVAFHMTGEQRYLDWMKAGVDVIRRQFIDRANGGMYEYMDLGTRQFGPEPDLRDPQQLGYGLLGMAFYYYLTRDESVLPDIMAVQRYIYAKYWSPSLGAMRWTAQSDSVQLVSCLDQMNTHLVLLAPIVPEPYRSELNAELRALVKSMLSVFYAPSSNLFFTSANDPRDTDLRYTGVDFGHTSKSLWMARFAGLIYGDPNLAAWAEAAAKRHLARAWIPLDGSWAEGVLPGGDIDLDKNWWIYSELDQLAGTLGEGAHLSDTFRYWTTYFVDRQYGDVWNGVRFGSNAPVRDYPKSWQWKNAYHAFEHALVGYISAGEMRGASYPLYYALTKDAPVQPYLLRSRFVAMETVAPGIQRATFAGSAPPVYPMDHAYSSASFLAAPLAPSSFGTVFGDSIGGAPGVTVTDSTGAIQTATVVGRAPNQINFVLPAGLPAGPAIVFAMASYQHQVNAKTTIAPVSPSVFELDAASLVAANIIRVKADGSQSYEPAAGGVSFGAASDKVYLAIYATGLRKAKAVSVTMRGREIPVLYAGAQGTTDGLDQVNVGPLPRSFAGWGRLTIVVTADGLTANPVQVEFR